MNEIHRLGLGFENHTAFQVLALVCCLLLSTTSQACFAPPGTQPSSETVQLTLPITLMNPAVIHPLKRYSVYVSGETLVAVLAKRRTSGVRGGLIANLKSRLPLQRDLITTAIAAPLAPPMPSPNDLYENREGTFRDRNFWAGIDQTFSDVMIEMLEKGQAALVSEATGEVLSSVTLERYKQACRGGRRIISPTGEAILWTVDWIS
jgi:hypothetical protein